MGLDKERAHEVLLTAKVFPDEPADAEYAIERLFNHGNFYEVDGDRRVTETETS